MKAHYRLYKETDINTVASNMCEADVTELSLSDGLNPLAALQRACEKSHEVNTMVSPSGELLGMFGLSFIDEHTGSPWMLSTGKLNKYYIQFLRSSHNWVIEANNKRNLLVNYVHVENKLAIKWLQFLGFSFLRELQYGKSKAPFYEFVRIK